MGNLVHTAQNAVECREILFLVESFLTFTHLNVMRFVEDKYIQPEIDQISRVFKI